MLGNITLMKAIDRMANTAQSMPRYAQHLSITHATTITSSDSAAIMPNIVQYVSVMFFENGTNIPPSTPAVMIAISVFPTQL